MKFNTPKALKKVIRETDKGQINAHMKQHKHTSKDKMQTKLQLFCRWLYKPFCSEQQHGCHHENTPI